MTKKSFVLFADYLQHIELLSREDRGDVLTAILCYVSGDKIPDLSTGAAVAFSFIRAQIDRDNEKHLAYCEKQRENGQKGGRPKKANGFDENPNNPPVISKSHENRNNAAPDENPPHISRNPNNPPVISETQKSHNDTDTDTETEETPVCVLFNTDDVNLSQKQDACVNRSDVGKKNSARAHGAGGAQIIHYGPHNRIPLSIDQHRRLIEEFGGNAVGRAINILDDYVQRTGKHYADWNLQVRTAIKEKWEPRRQKTQPPTNNEEEQYAYQRNAANKYNGI